MISTTQTIQISSINVSFDPQGVKIVSGYCSFSHYSKDGVVEETIAYRAKGAPALSISEQLATGVAIGYLDIKVVDNGTYKSKVITLVIRSFIPTTVAVVETAPTQAIAKRCCEAQIAPVESAPVVPAPLEPAAVVPIVPAKKTNKPKKEKQLVSAGVVGTNNGKGRLSVVMDEEHIPF